MDVRDAWFDLSVEMDLRLREVTWLRLLSLLAWTILAMLKRGICQLMDLIEGRVFEGGDRVADVRVVRRAAEIATLLPPLSTELVLTRIWPLFHRKVNISLMWRLRRVSRAWRESVSTTLEWTALEFVRIDTPGYTQYLENRGENRPSLRERVEDELVSLQRLLSERLSDFSLRSELLLSEPSSYEEDIESSRNWSCDCADAGFPWQEDRCSGSESDCRQSDENCDSSSESSLRVYFPRHVMRIKN